MRELAYTSEPMLNVVHTRLVGDAMHSHHYHSFYEIYYMLSGKCSYFIDNRSFEVVPGDVVLIPAGVIHRTGYDGNEHSRLLIECSLEYIPDCVRERLSQMPYLYRNPAVEKELSTMLRRIEEEFKNPDEYSEQSLKTRMHSLFFLLVRNRGFESASSHKHEMIEDIISFIKHNYHTDIRLTTVAESHFVSPEHLSRTFKRDTGFGFSEYLTLVRLQHAENMLKEKDGKTISEIAYSCGFNDSNYFSDKFKRAYGVSPLKFRSRSWAMRSPWKAAMLIPWLPLWNPPARSWAIWLSATRMS